AHKVARPQHLKPTDNHEYDDVAILLKLAQRLSAACHGPGSVVTRPTPTSVQMGRRYRRDKHNGCRGHEALLGSPPGLFAPFRPSDGNSRIQMILIRYGQTEFNRIFS